MGNVLFTLLALASPAPDAVSAASAPASELYRQILQCKDRLTDAPPVSNRITGEDAVLCVAHGGGIDLVRVSGGISRTPGFTVELVRRNGANSNYRVVRTEGGKVLGIKTNVTGKRVQVGTKVIRAKDARGRWVRRRIPVFKDRVKTVVYVPYSEAVHEPAVVRAGFDYTVCRVDEARDRLDALGVTTRLDAHLPVEQRRLVTEVVSERTIIGLLGIEHIDPSWIKKDGADFDDADWIDPVKLDRILGLVFVTVGLNGEDAYDFAISDAKASGFAQFIKPTYLRIRKEYVEAGFHPDFVEGMRDHLNAVMAQFCLADWSLTVLSAESRAVLMDGAHEEDLGAYIAAAYNGGEHRAGPAYDFDPANWDKKRPQTADERACERACKKRCKKRGRQACEDRCGKRCVMIPRIPGQTRTYVQEFRAVYRYLFVHPAPHPHEHALSAPIIP